MKTSPTQRSLEYVRKQGYFAQVVEKWNPFAKVRQDLFGWIDIVAVGNGLILGIQTTSYPNGKARLLKAKEITKKSLALCHWREGGGLLMLHEWKKVKGKWMVTVTTLGPEDLE